MKEKYCFKVNGVVRSTEENKPLLRYLSDDLHLHSVKDGCSEGACGTCTIIVDGKAVKSWCADHEACRGAQYYHYRRTQRRREGSLCICLWLKRIRSVRILYSGHGDGRKGSDRPGA